MNIRAWFKGREINGKFSIWVPDIEAKITSPETLKRDLEYAIRSKVEEEIKKFVEMEIDREILRKIAADLLKDFEYKPIMEKAMLEKFETYVRGAANGPSYAYVNQQALLAQQRGY